MRLTLVRHPAPQIAPGLCYGSSDVPAQPQALAQALDALAANLPRTDDIVMYSSPLQRCAALSVALAARLNLASPLFDARLAEMHFGHWERRSWDSIARADIDAWTADLLHYAPGGGETVLQVAHRVAAFLDMLRRATDHHAIVICHAGTIRLLGALHQAALRGETLTGAALAAAALQAAATPHSIAYASTVSLQF
jgi:alpha-ribazole phosphatase